MVGVPTHECYAELVDKSAAINLFPHRYDGRPEAGQGLNGGEVPRQHDGHERRGHVDGPAYLHCVDIGISRVEEAKE